MASQLNLNDLVTRCHNHPRDTALRSPGRWHVRRAARLSAAPVVARERATLSRSHCVSLVVDVIAVIFPNRRKSSRREMIKRIRNQAATLLRALESPTESNSLATLTRRGFAGALGAGTIMALLGMTRHEDSLLCDVDARKSHRNFPPCPGGYCAGAACDQGCAPHEPGPGEICWQAPNTPQPKWKHCWCRGSVGDLTMICDCDCTGCNLGVCQCEAPDDACDGGGFL